MPRYITDGVPMLRNGIVLELRGKEALVSMSGGEGCGSCESKHACFSLTGGRSKEIRFWMENEAGASPGDIVELEISPGASLRVIIVTFLVPVLLLAAGYLLMSNGDDRSRALGAGAGLVVGIALAILANRKLSRREGGDMRMIRVSGNCKDDPSN